YEEKHKYNLQFNCYAQYYKDFSDMQHFDVMVGYEWQHFYNDYYTNGSGFNNPTYFEQRDMNQRYNTYINSSATESYLVSFFGRVNWVGWNQVMLTATVRGDGSSRFAPGKQWGVFPSVALGWKIKESFFRDVNWLDDFKLRAGYGITGQQNLNQGDYPGLILYAPSQVYADYTLGEIDPATGEYIYYQSARPQAYNQDLTWEKTTTYNVGFDFGFLKNRISGNIDYYYRYTTDLIAMVDVPLGTNFKNQVISNIGSLSNQGVEFMINAVAIDNRKLKWDLGLNFTYNINKIEHLTSGEGENYYVTTGGVSAGTGNTIQRHQEGYAANTFWVYESYYNDYGKLEIVDQDNNGLINDEDLIPYHKSAPDFQIALQSKWQFYNFDLSFSLRSNIGNYVYNDVLANKTFGMKTLAREGGYTNVIVAAMPLYDATTGSSTVTTDNTWRLSEFVENGSFLRCDNITLGYTFTQNPNVNARIYATVSNPFVISGYRGLDPEVFSGIDNNIYPRSLSAVLGVSLQF
ncbi:MAG: TonB-dependent receptor, partial [Paludibacteraceae bacterium]|nr:TonB-dependent receptor [Paludibacteraceae bacterium]